MKRFFYFLICLAVIVSVMAGATTVSAAGTNEGGTNTGEEQEQGSAAVISGETGTGDSYDDYLDKNYTFFGRIWEYVNTNKDAVLTTIGDGALLLIYTIVYLKQKKKSSTLSDTVSVISKNTGSVSTSQGAVVEVVNKLIDGYDSMQKSYEEYGGTEDDRNKLVGALVAQNTAILEILTTVYANSKNLPQGVKDLVNIKYANCLKALDNDKKLAGIVSAVREEFQSRIAENDTDSDEDTSETEG